MVRIAQDSKSYKQVQLIASCRANEDAGAGASSMLCGDGNVFNVVVFDVEIDDWYLDEVIIVDEAKVSGLSIKFGKLQTEWQCSSRD